MATGSDATLTCLPARWDEFWQRIGAAADEVPPFGPIAEAYRAPGRHYHNLRHIAACLTEFDEVRGSAESGDVVELAIWYHDLVYDPRRGDNEERSAQSLAAAVAGLGETPSLAAAPSLVLATAHRCPPAAADERLMVDVDLAILGQPAPAFDEYERQIRLEYAHVPDAMFAAGRARVLRSFLDRRAIYSTPQFRNRYEAAARGNLALSLVRLSAGR